MLNTHPEEFKARALTHNSQKESNLTAQPQMNGEAYMMAENSALRERVLCTEYNTMNLEDMVLNERSQSCRHTQCSIPFTWETWTSEI